jgi:3-deoxy-manno-octulosonate cytidylyltransferase (CMP-KDO synthetase)
MLTTDVFRTGTDRVAGAAKQLPGEFFLDLQGDEIAMDSRLISDLIESFLASRTSMGTLKRKLTSAEDLRNPGVVKVVTDRNGEALYFSRASIPLVRDAPAGTVLPELHYLHVGLYMYTRATLEALAALPSGPLEEAEKLEQLRALEHGIHIRVWETEHQSLRIDTPQDLIEAEAALQRQEAVGRRS